MPVTTSWVRISCACALLVASASWAQTAPPPAPARDTPRPDQLEPGVNTSAPAANAVPAADGAPTSSAAAAAAANAAAPPVTTSVTSKGASKGSPSAAAKGTVAPTGSGVLATAPKTGAAGKAQDRLELDTTQITGNRELPKVLYIVPWKRSDLGDLVGKPVNSLLDEVLAPVDRDVFKRENRYYDALKPDQGGPAAGTGAAPPAGEKH